MNKKFFYFFREEKEFKEYLKFYNISNSSNLIKNESLFSTKYKTITQNHLDLYDCIIITSPQSIKAIDKNNLSLNKQNLIIVGEHSANKIEKIANNAPNNILCIGENIKSVTQFIENNLSLFHHKKILYLRGNYIAFDIKNHLKGKIEINELEIYNLEYKEKFSEKFEINLKKNNISHLAFFSYKSVEKFFEICNTLNEKYNFREIKIYVMNEGSKLIADQYSHYAEIITTKLLVEKIKDFLNN